MRDSAFLCAVTYPFVSLPFFFYPSFTAFPFSILILLSLLYSGEPQAKL